MPDYRKDIGRLALAIALLMAVAWSPYLFFGKTLLASASDVASIYPAGAQPAPDVDAHMPRSLDSGAPGWQNEPWLALQHRLVFDERVLPMWNPYDAYGAPFAASMLAQPFYPLAFAASIHPTPWTYNLLVVARLFLLALGCALFVRLFTGFVPALVAGICAAFSGYFILYADIVHVGVEVMLPWILLGIEIVVRRPSARNAALLGAAWAVSLLGGMPESSALASIVFGLYGLFRVLLERRDGGTFKRLLWIASGLGVGTAVAGIMLVPFLEYLTRDFDQHQSRPPGLAYDGFQARFLLTEFAPLAFGPPVNSILSAFSGFSGARGGPGTVAIMLAATAGITAIGAFERRTRRDSVALFLVVVAVGFEAKRFGVPIVHWIGAIPLIRLSNFPKYGEADIAVCIACAAGLGVAAILDRRVGYWQLLGALALVLGVVTWLYDGIVLPPEAVHLGFFYTAFGSIVALMVSTAVVMAYAAKTKRKALVASALIGLALIDGAFALFVPLYYVFNRPPSGARNPYAGAPFVTYLQQATARDATRIVGTGIILYPDWASAFGLYDTRALSAMYPERYLKFVDTFVAREPPTFDDQFDRFTGSRAIDFDDPLVQRWLTLSSVGYIVNLTQLPPKPGPTAFLAALWNQNKPLLTPTRSAGLRLSTAEIDGVAENVLFDHPPDRSVFYRTNVPAAFPQLSVDVALDPNVWDTHCGGAVSFAIEALNAGGYTIGTALRTIDPKHLVRDRHWNRLSLDLRSLAGRPVSLRFTTSVPPPGDLCGAWALWGEPRWSVAGDVRKFQNTRHPGFALIPGIPNASVYRVDSPLPRLSLFHHTQLAASGDDALHVIAHTPFDPRRTVVIEGNMPATSGSGQGDSVEHIERSSQRVAADVTTASDAVLLQNDTWYPGWQATVDGQAAPIFRADYLFRAIAIPAGRHHVVIQYRSRAVALGLALSIAGLIVLTLMLVIKPAIGQSLRRVYSIRRANA